MTPIAKSLVAAFAVALVVGGTLMLRPRPAPVAKAQLTPAQLAEIQPPRAEPAKPPSPAVSIPPAPPPPPEDQADDPDFEDGSGS